MILREKLLMSTAGGQEVYMTPMFLVTLELTARLEMAHFHTVQITSSRF